MPKRICVLFCGIILCFALLVCRLSLLSTNTVYADAAAAQSTYYLDFEDGRGNFYDCQFRRLTGITYSTYALVAPSSESYRTLFDVVPQSSRTFLYENIQKSAPFLIGIAEDVAVDCPTFLHQNRYMPTPIAPQLIGYRDSTGKGVAGLEAACNDALEKGSTTERIYCAVDARGNFIGSEAPRLVAEQGTGTGIMLTLDASLQRLCEAVARDKMDQGSIVVMETATGRIRASVSMPDYDPSNVAASLNNAGSPFVNRSISSYNVGSVFKPLLAAAALEVGADTGETYECDGSITVADHTYRCAYGKGHGAVDLRGALAQSCNCYFIDLGMKLGGETLVKYMESVGFGESNVLAGTLRTARGNIPTVEELNNLGAIASVSFGQGTLTASPVQVAAMFNTIANKGVYLSPTFVEGYVNEYSEIVTQSLYAPVMHRCFSESTAETLRNMLVNVVENGLGKDAKPQRGSAGGKTGTAQTGRMNEDGEEIMDAWFAGFYPAVSPEYTIVVMLDSGTHDSDDACAIFARVADALAYFTQVNANNAAWGETGTAAASVSQITAAENSKEATSIESSTETQKDAA